MYCQSKLMERGNETADFVITEWLNRLNMPWAVTWLEAIKGGVQ